MAIRQHQLIKDLNILREEYLGSDSIEKRISTNRDGVYVQQLGYSKTYFIEGEYNNKKVYFLRIEDFINENKVETHYLRTDENKELMDIQGEDEWVENDELYNDLVWYDLI